MGKYPIYAIVAFIFIGIIKLLQVTVFDVEQYNKNKKASFSKSGDKMETPIKSEIKGDKKTNLSEAESKPSEATPSPPILDREEKEQEAEVPNKTEEDESFQSPPVEKKPETAYQDLIELKNLYLAPKLASLPPGQLREDVVIRYYRHDKDGDKVYSLRELGYYIHEKEAIETAGLGSNVLYYGRDIALEDIQIVAYTLLEKGLPLKAIEPTQFSWKSNSLEIGTDTLRLEDSILSKNDIKNFRK